METDPSPSAEEPRGREAPDQPLGTVRHRLRARYANAGMVGVLLTLLLPNSSGWGTAPTAQEMQRYREYQPVRWPLALTTLLVSLLLSRAWLVLWSRGGWSLMVLGPVVLWWAIHLLIVAVVTALWGVRPTPWRRHLTFGAALLVGAWMGSAGLPYWSMAILCLYAVVERVLMLHWYPPNDAWAAAPLSVWMTLIVSGLMAGFMGGRGVGVLIG